MTREGLEQFRMRMKDMPIMMDRLCGIVYAVLVGNVTFEFFVKQYPDEAVPWYKRIALGEQAELYQENYAPEIELFKQVSALCEAVRKEELEDASFLTRLEDAVEKYMSVEIHRKTNFII